MPANRFSNAASSVLYSFPVPVTTITNSVPVRATTEIE